METSCPKAPLWTRVFFIMNQNLNDNLDCKRGSVAELLAIALPMVISSACEVIMTFTDRLFLSKLGPELMNAAMGGGITCFMMMTFVFGLTGFSTAMVAQYLGAGKKDQCAKVTAQTLIICLAAYPLILLASPIGIWLFRFSGVAEEQLIHQIAYFNILIYAVIIGMVRNALSCFFSGIGKTRIVMIAAMASMLVNIVMNYVLIFGKLGFPAMGIRGAAYGTIAGGICGVIILIAAYFGPKNSRQYNVKHSFRFNANIMKRLFKFGYPAGVEFLLNLLAFNAMILIFHSHSLETATAVTILFNWDMVAFVPLIGVGIGVTSLVGRYMGASDPDSAHRATISGLKTGWAYSAVMLVLFAGFPGFMVEIFRPNETSEVFETAAPIALFLMRTVAFYVMAQAVIIVFSSALRGAGDTFWTMCISVGLHWLLVPTAYIMLNVFNASTQTTWVTVILVFVAFTFCFYLRYRHGKWRSIKVVHHEEEDLIPPHEGFHETPDI